MPKKIEILLLFVFLVFFLAPVLADSARPLEVKYPAVPEAPSLATVEVGIPAYVRYVFNFFIWITGFIALGVLVYAGFRYLTSAGRPEALIDAKNQILAALAGLLILLSSWLILTTINPQLKHLEIKPLPPVAPPLSVGVYLCTEWINEIYWAWDLIKEIKNMKPDDPQREQKIKQLNGYLKKINETCWRVLTSGEIPEKFNDKTQAAYVVSSKADALYGAVLYDESEFGGRAQVIYYDVGVHGFKVTAIKPSSVRAFILKQPRSGVYVEVYELIDFNRADPQKKSEKHTLSNLYSHCIDVSDFSTLGSVKIEGDLIVIFFKDEGKCQDWQSDVVLDVVVNTDANLYNNLVGSWCSKKVWLKTEYWPCPKDMVIVSGSIY